MRSIGFILAASLPLLLFQGCSAPSTPKAELKTALAIPMGADTRPIGIEKVVVKLQRGETVGHIALGLFCGRPLHPVRWGHRTADEDLRDALRDEFTKANYTVVGDPHTLFPDRTASKAELLVAGAIDNIAANGCAPDFYGSNPNMIKGGAFVHVTWQVYDPLKKKVVYETTTQGSYETDKPVYDGMPTFMTNAFASAAQNLLAEPGFRDLALRPRDRTAGAVGEPAYVSLFIKPAPKTHQSISDARAAVVTVFIPQALGSGFIISPNGYMITNYHVVEEARFVKVRLANGRDVLGDVVRSDSVRDVALVKLAEKNLPSLSLRLTTSPEVGDEVYAIGSPLGEEQADTVSRGIMSAYRDRGKLKFIQSDVLVQHGSSGGPLLDKDGEVVGICQGGETSDVDRSVGLNYFIPIADAVTRLGVKFK
ncbi:MAG: trypsin-like peptidase domain-containing protein [Syntrophorhabdales bacterium]|jgi:hypothetical protein